MDNVVYPDWISKWLRQLLDRPMPTYVYSRSAFAFRLLPCTLKSMLDCIIFRQKSQGLFLCSI